MLFAMNFYAEKLLKHLLLRKSTMRQQGFGLRKTRRRQESEALPQTSTKAAFDLSGAAEYVIPRNLFTEMNRLNPFIIGFKFGVFYQILAQKVFIYSRCTFFNIFESFNR